MIAHASLISFLERWSYTEIELIDEAKSAYTPIIILSLIELVIALAIIAVTVIIMREFMLNNTKVRPSDEKYSIPDKDFHRSLFIKSLVYALSGAVVMLSKFLLVLLNSGANYIYADSADGGVAAIVTTAIPWFGTFVTILALIFIGASIYYYGILKDEVTMKYQ